MFARLTSKAEQREKDKRACNKRPAIHLQSKGYRRVIPPKEACDLSDLGTVAMHASPALPGYDTHLRTGHDVIRPYRNGPEYLGG
jgi:hypothetical protein